MILVTGGAGYIGAHTNKALNQAGYETVVVDNLVKGYEDFVKWGHFENYDFGSKDLREVFEKYDIDGVLHFGAFSSVAESVELPQKYFKNNYKNTINLLQIMREFGVNKFILSSTAAVYGNPEKVPITEDQELKPINPYGHSKFITEKALEREAAKGDFNYVALRYFNAAGCDFDCEIGELHEPETHLIPLVLDAAIGRRDSISIFGTDYNTPDGTCVRDYIHVNDLAKAHIDAYEYLCNENESNVFNLGNGKGFSVKEVIDMVKKVTGKDFPVKLDERREGDPDILIADATKIKDKLGWTPQYDLETIVESAWNWHKKIYQDLVIAMENENSVISKVDVRIIVSGLDIAEVVSKSVDNTQLENDYNIIVSSIIPTNNFEIAKKVAAGGDIILIGGYGQDENYNLLFNDLKTDFNHVGLFDYNNIIKNETVDSNLAANEILNSIIRAALSYSLNLVNVHTLENKLLNLTHKYNSLLDDYNKLIEDYDDVSLKNKELQETIDNLKSDFTSFKSRYEDIYSKEFLEIYNLNDLWQEVFRENLADADKVTIATNKFKPENIIVGQGYIGAQSRQDAIDWLKIIKTALIFVGNDEEDLKKDLNKTSEVEDDYDISNNFENFWD